MPRGTALSVCRTMLKAEVGDFSGTNTARDAELNQLLFNKQYQLSLEKDWSFLVRRWDAQVAAGQRFVAFPTVDADLAETVSINLDNIIKVEVRWNNQYYPMLEGIGQEEYNLMDPTLGQAADPITRWREASNVVEPTGSNKFEVWPQPVSNQIVRFTANRLLQPFAADSDKCDIDDQLIVLGCAVDILMRTKQADAQIKVQQFSRRLHQIGSRLKTRDVRRGLGVGIEGDRRKDIKLVAIH